MKPIALALAAIGLATPAIAQPAAAPGAAPAAPSPAPVEGVGVVRAVNVKARSVTLDHEAIPSLGWPAMTMGFKVADPKLLDGVKPGTKVRFQLQDHVITAMGQL